jgi:hypothetical protein
VTSTPTPTPPWMPSPPTPSRTASR